MYVQNTHIGHTWSQSDPCSPNPCGENTRCSSSRYYCFYVQPLDVSQVNPCGENMRCSSSRYYCFYVQPLNVSQVNPCGENTRCSSSRYYWLSFLPLDVSQVNPCGENTRCSWIIRMEWFGTFFEFWKATHFCRSGIFWGVQCLNFRKFSHASKCRMNGKAFIFKNHRDLKNCECHPFIVGHTSASSASSASSTSSANS